MDKNPDFFARLLLIWCWTCGKTSTHEVTWRWGGRCYQCRDCGQMVVEKTIHSRKN